MIGLILTIIASLLLFYVADIVASMFCMQTSLLEAYEFLSKNLFSVEIVNPAYFSISLVPILLGLGFAIIPWLFYVNAYAKSKMRKGEEYGSAEWGTLKEGKKFLNQKSPDDNILFSKNYGIATKRDKFDLEHDRNCNVLVVGGSGSGKTRYYVKPNLLQMNSSYFVTDPKGTLIGETGQGMADSGYDVRCFDTINFYGYYNPLYYVKTDEDILSFVECLIKNTKGSDDAPSGDPFWDDAERLYYVSLISYLRDWCNPKDYTLSGLLTLMSLAKAKEEDEGYESPLDLLFKEIETGKCLMAVDDDQPQDKQKVDRGFRVREKVVGCEEQPSQLRNNYTHKTLEETGGLGVEQDFALNKYKSFKVAAGKTLKSILISCNVRVMALTTRQIRPMLSGVPDENGVGTGVCGLKLDTLGDKGRKAIIYAIMSDTDPTFSFLHAICMWQTINLLCNKALKDYGGRLPTSVNFILDEFANIGKLPNIEKTIAVTRSRNIFLSIILQSLAQLEERYNKAADTIVDCCDSTVFLGGKSNKTNKEISETLGKGTIEVQTINESSGQSSSTTKNQQKIGRELLDAAEIGKMSRSKALVMIAGAKPLKDKKYPLEQHPRYSLIDPGHKPVRVKSWMNSQSLFEKQPAKYQELFDIRAYDEAKRKRKEKEVMT